MSTFHQELKPRFAAVGLVALLALGALLVRLWTIQVLNGESYAALAENNRVREISLEAPRGRIFDRNGVELVTNRPALAVAVDPGHEVIRGLLLRAQNDDPADDPTPEELSEVFGGLGDLIGKTPAEIFEKVADVNQEPLRPRVVALDADMGVVAQLLERQEDFPWVRVEEIAVREYPFGSLAAHVLGYTGAISKEEYESAHEYAGYELGDIVGKTGAERQFEAVLQGDKGWRRIEVNASGKPQGVVSEQPPRPGNDVKLTIDIEVQRVAEEQLAAALDYARRQNHTNAKAGAVVVVDVTTGEVLAMASAPTYDPEAFVGGISAKEWARLNAKQSEYPLNNRAVMAAYPAASTFKAFTGLAALEAGITYENKTYYCAGRWTDMGAKWPKWCWKRSGHGTITFREGIEQSCDTVFYEIGYEFYLRKKEELQAMARAFGLGAATGIDLPGEVTGRIPDIAWKKEFNRNYPEYQMWLPGDTVNMAIGQGDVLVTPLQMAVAYAGIANHGKVMRPHVLKEVLDSSGTAVKTFEPEVLHATGVSEKSLAVMERALVDVTRTGTARGSFSGFGVTVAGKTGTAEVKGKDDYAWFCAYAPAEAPRYAVAVVIEQAGHGGALAAPVARNVLAKLLGEPLVTAWATDDSR